MIEIMYKSYIDIFSWDKIHTSQVDIFRFNFDDFKLKINGYVYLKKSRKCIKAYKAEQIWESLQQ